MPPPSYNISVMLRTDPFNGLGSGTRLGECSPQGPGESVPPPHQRPDRDRLGKNLLQELLPASSLSCAAGGPSTWPDQGTHGKKREKSKKTPLPPFVRHPVRKSVNNAKIKTEKN
ncbi:MAG: hypothetical protein ACYCYP_11920 [Leptospirales bacterium]